MQAHFQESELTKTVEKYLDPAVKLTDNPTEIVGVKEKTVACMGEFKSEKDSRELIRDGISGTTR